MDGPCDAAVFVTRGSWSAGAADYERYKAALSRAIKVN